VTGADGSYQITGLDDGNYRLKTINAAGYVDRVRGGDTCSPEPCNIFSGSTVNVASSDELGVDISLQQGDVISGVATDSTGVPLPSGTATVYSATGQVVKTGGIFGGSFYINGLANGTYYMLVTNGSGLVDELWQNIPCPGGSCDVTSGAPIELTDAAAVLVQMESITAQSAQSGPEPLADVSTSRLVFEMDQGTVLSGTVKNVSNEPLQFVTVYILDSVGKLAGTAETNALGEFVTKSSFPDGTYYATTSLTGLGGIGDGYIDEWFVDGGEVLCAGECLGSATAGTPITIPGALTESINFVLDTGKSISGNVTEAGSGDPLPSTSVLLFNDLADSYADAIATTETDGAGNYEFPGLVPGSYYLVARHPSGDYSDVLFDGTICNDCDPSTGTVITISGVDVSGTDISVPLLPAITIEKFTNGVNGDSPTAGNAPVLEPGAAITWTFTVTNTGGEPLENLVVTDDIEGTITCPQTVLAVGESIDCTQQGTAVDLSAQSPFQGVFGICEGEPGKRLYQNTGTVSAETAGGVTQVQDSDPSHYCNPAPKGDLIFKDGFES
jgi:uncharacterized repeat protein (TIGR01451 family)